jgi:hypothetical protein
MIGQGLEGHAGYPVELFEIKILVLLVRTFFMPNARQRSPLAQIRLIPAFSCDLLWCLMLKKEKKFARSLFL